MEANEWFKVTFYIKPTDTIPDYKLEQKITKALKRVGVTIYLDAMNIKKGGKG